MEHCYDDDGREILDSRPVEIPSGMKRPETLTETIQRMVRTNFSKIAESQGFESFEEAHDFDLPDDDFDLPISESEERAMTLERLKDDAELLQEREREIKERKVYEERFGKGKESVSVSGKRGKSVASEGGVARDGSEERNRRERGGKREKSESGASDSE